MGWEDRDKVGGKDTEAYKSEQRLRRVRDSEDKGTANQREGRDLEKRGQSLREVRAESGGQLFRERGEKETHKRERGMGGGLYEPATAPAEGGGRSGTEQQEETRSP